jgi:hypothetical protein
LYRNYLSKGPWFDPESGEYTYLNENRLDWIRFLLSEGIDKIREVEGTGRGDLSQIPARAATIYRAFLVLANDISQKAWEEAEALNLRGSEARKFVEEYINNTLEHEVYHFLEPDELPKRASEARAGELQSEFCGEQARLREGTVEGRIYAILAKYRAAYAEAARTGELGKSKLSKLETLAKEYEAKARASGLEEGEIGDYVEEQLEAYAKKEIEGTDSEKTAEKGDLEAKTADTDNDLDDSAASEDGDTGEGE